MAGSKGGDHWNKHRTPVSYVRGGLVWVLEKGSSPELDTGMGFPEKWSQHSNQISRNVWKILLGTW